MNIKKRLALTGIILTTLAGIISGFDMIGETATTAKILIVFFSGFGGGVSLMQFIQKRKPNF
ncbi:MAG: hypothetical protein HQ541_13980 [Mariniphaga sp.]|nr:hypothetical protein [Mariniphaga sp.]